MKKIYDYIWLGGNDEFRSKSRVLELKDGEEVPMWNYDGSSTNQADGKNSEIILKPCAVYEYPFHSDIPRYLILCCTYDSFGNPLPNNYRHVTQEIFEKYKLKEPWYGLEQEYFLYDVKNNKILGYDDNKKQGQFYCGVGCTNVYGREIVESHMIACIKAGLNISGINAEVAPGQWEFQIGPSIGIEAGDQLMMARYLLELIAEKHDIKIIWHPKPLKGNWNGSGCHINFSTIEMREENGIEHIEKSIIKLSHKHKEHLEVYGKHNEERLTGEHETSSISNFTVGRANRGASIRIGNDTINNKKGYFEDRRPSSNCNPYLATSIILQTIYE